MSVALVKHPDYFKGEYAQLEIDSTVQPDSVFIWDESRNRLGFGYGSHATTAFGWGVGPGFGVGLFAEAYFGQGAKKIDHLTYKKFVAGDYSVRTRSYDEIGNVSSWSSTSTLEHRPKPPAPIELALGSGSVLTWTWTDG